MHVIPVVDIKNGLAVHAKQGLRAHYAPIHSPLCQNAAIDALISAYLTLYPFKTFYIADLNAINAHDPQQALIEALLQNYPQLTFWIDSGYQAEPHLYQNFPNHIPVLGSETYLNTHVSALKNFNKRFVLSLDFLGAKSLGAEQLFNTSELWPKNIILMTLHRVGGLDGPDFEKLSAFGKQFPQHRFIAAGGIRDIEDLHALQKIKIDTALIASALHSGAINAEQLKVLEKEAVKTLASRFD